MSESSVRILIGITEEYQKQAAEIYYDAFQLKLAPLKGSRERVVALLAVGWQACIMTAVISLK